MVSFGITYMTYKNVFCVGHVHDRLLNSSKKNRGFTSKVISFHLSIKKVAQKHSLLLLHVPFYEKNAESFLINSNHNMYILQQLYYYVLILCVLILYNNPAVNLICNKLLTCHR